MEKNSTGGKVIQFEKNNNIIIFNFFLFWENFNFDDQSEII